MFREICRRIYITETEESTSTASCGNTENTIYRYFVPGFQGLSMKCEVFYVNLTLRYIDIDMYHAS